MNESYENYQTDVDAIESVSNGNYGGILPFSRERVAMMIETAYDVSNGRAFLASQALKNIATLSKEEEILSNLSPAGTARYKSIVDAAALSDAIMISQIRGVMLCLFGY